LWQFSIETTKFPLEEFSVVGRRPRGRPRRPTTWLRGADADVQSANIGIHSAKRKANDRVLCDVSSTRQHSIRDTPLKKKKRKKKKKKNMKKKKKKEETNSWCNTISTFVPQWQYTCQCQFLHLQRIVGVNRYNALDALTPCRQKRLQ